jgi:TonB-dependent heme/hemoglobin receptor
MEIRGGSMLVPVLLVSNLYATAQAAEMSTVVVTATRVEEQVFEVPQAVTRMDREEIEEGIYRSTPEALMQQPGVMVQKTAHGQGSPFIRGLTGKHVLILVDGVRLNNATFRFGPNQYLATIDPASIDHIEIVRGPASVLYGSDALGGVINIFTRKRQDFSQERDTDGELNPVYGSADNERTYRGALEGNVSSFGFWGGGDYRDFGNLKGGGDVGTQNYTGYDEYHANAALSYKLAGQGRMDLTVQQTRQNDVPRTDKFINSNESQVFDPQQRTAVAAHMQGAPGLVFADRMQVSLSYQLQKENLERQRFGSDLVRNYKDKVYTAGLTTQADLLLGERHLLTYGLEYYRDRVDSHRVDTTAGVSTPATSNFPDGSEYYTGGLFLQDEYLLTDATTLVGGLRYSRFRVESDLEDFGNLDETFDDWTGSLRFTTAITPQWRLFGGVAMGFRAPNLDDLVVLRSTNEGTDVPSPNLDSEESINYELGLKLNSSRWQGTAVAYYSDYSDLIERGPGTYQGLSFIDDNGNGVQDEGEDNVVQKFNVGDAYIWGVELDARVTLNPVWSVFGNYSYTYGRNQSGDEPLSRIPPARLVLGVRRQVPGDSWWVEPYTEIVGDQDRLSARDESDPRIGSNGTDGYTTLNVRGGWEIARQHALNVAFNNIADVKYKVHGSGVYGPGREVKLSYHYRF